MFWKGRNLYVFIAFLLLAMFAGGILALTIVGPLSFAQQGQAGRQPSTGFTAEELRKLSATYDLIRNEYLYEVDRKKVIDGAITGMLEALGDPYTTYLDQKQAEQFEEVLHSSFQGIGAEVSMENGRVKVVAPIKGSPAEKAGLKPNDIIVSVNGETLEGLSLTEAVMKIRGPKGSQARLEIVRGSSEPIEIVIVRDDIPIETVFSEVLEGNIGKLEIREFSFNTPKRFNEELANLESQGIRGLIIDVRSNPGGLLPVVIDMLNQLVPKGKTIVQVEDRNGNREKTVSEGPGRSYPIAVLIDAGSASASEIMAAAIREAAGGKLVGEKSFGKGTVQITFEKEMGDGSNIKMTVMKWLTPDGNWIHEKGIEPDIPVEQPAYFKAAPMSKKTTLKFDMTNEDVKNLQIMLEGLGLDPGRTDGYFSEKTAEAVRRFQEANGLPANGEVDVKTAEKIEEAITKQIRDPKNDLQLQAAVQYLKTAIGQ
jgi:carboxyl-terminal processing protease